MLEISKNQQKKTHRCKLQIYDKLAAYEICKQIKFQLYTLSNKFLVTRKTTKVLMFSFLPICLQATSSQNLSILSFLPS